MLHVRVLGPVTLTNGDDEVMLPAGKPLGVLAMLALSGGRPVSADRLLIGLWGDDTGASSANTLQVHISTLRRRLRPVGIDVTLGRAGYELVATGIQIDAAAFERLVDEGSRALEERRPEIARRTLRAALALWSGPPLSNVLGSPFAAEEAERLSLRRVVAEVLAVDADLRLGLGVTLIDEIRALAAANPYDERVCGQLMVALYRAGRPAAALAEYEEFRRRLGEDLGLEPGPELVALEHQVLVHDAALLRTDGTPAVRAHNLNEDVSTFVGRSRECDELRARLDRARLVTITGAGGAGKTRLATKVAHSIVDAMADGVWFVDLSTIVDPRLVLAAIAKAVDESADDIDALVDGIGERRLLLVIDNCEHLVDHVADIVGSLLRRCPTVTVLATSREPLAIDGEAIYRIPPMVVPAVDAGPEVAGDSDAVALFVERARLRLPEFDLDVQSTPLVIAICARLDGLPLAIELAAARLGHLSLAEIAQRLQQRLGLLAGANRRTLGRQQTLRALIDWSYDLLSSDEQRLLEGLAVFAGGFEVAAVESVIPAGERTVDVLGMLVDKSLVEFFDPAAARFHLLETIREYAADRLTDSGVDVVTELRQAHASFFADLARVGGEALEHGADQRDWLDRLTRDHDNIRAAMATMLETGDRARALQLVSDLRLFWDARGNYREGADVAMAVIDAAAPGEAPRAYGNALLTAADMLESLGDHDAMIVCAERAQQLASDFDEPTVRLGAALIMANVDVLRGHPHDARRRIAALDLTDVESVMVRRAQFTDAYAAMAAEDWTGAKSVLRALVEVEEISGNERRLAMTLSNLASVQMAQGDVDGARSSLEWASTVVAPLDASSLGYINVNLGLLAHLTGDLFMASVRYREALLNSAQESIVAHCGLLGLTLCAGLDPPDGDNAVRLHGAIGRFMEAHPLSLDVTERRLCAADRERRRERLGDQRFAQLIAEGGRLQLADAIDIAHSIRPPVDAR